MQYVHRKLQRSVTEMRRSRSGRERLSSTPSIVARSDLRADEDREVHDEQHDHHVVEERPGSAGAICTIPQSANALGRIDRVRSPRRSSWRATT
jgi:hypothetical protein